MMLRLRPDPIPLGTQARILDAAMRAPNGGNTQRWHFVAVDDPELIREFAQLFRQARDIEYEKFEIHHPDHRRSGLDHRASISRRHDHRSAPPYT